ncbi:MAG TPA: LuxR C-terminal-related transcriptional regulator [Gaiellaceae bacterium]|nr:LuxR C-terminal-related transcriptional regulator [Gaiellaceae bacterium]
MAQQRDALAEAAREAIAALEIVPLPASLIDESRVIRWQNEPSRVLRGLRVGSDFLDFVAPEDRDDSRRLFERLLAEGSAHSHTQVLDARGGYEALEARWTVVELANGDRAVVTVSMEGVNDRPNSPARADWAATLTPRQLEVLRLLGAGRSTSEIANELGVSSTTVRNHVAHLLSELGAHSRLQAVVAAHEAGLLGH